MGVKAAALATKIQIFSLALPAPSWAGRVAVLVIAVYLVLLPHVARTWRATGDEPHYLLAAHSLATDGDFDLANNYRQQDYLAFYLSRDIVPQVRTDPAGRQILTHGLGLPVLIALPYALAGRLGVLIFQSLLGGLLAGLTFKLAVLVAPGDKTAALVATLFVALSPPLLLYNYLVYPELAGALLITGLLYLALREKAPGPAILAGAGLALAFLPWLNRRFGVFAVVLGLLLAWQSWQHSKREAAPVEGPAGNASPSFRLSLLPFVLAPLLSLVLLIWFNSRLSAPARADFVATTEPAVLWERLSRGVGWLVDQQRGLLVYSPVYALALGGLPRLWYGRRWERIVLLPLLLALGTTTLAGGFWTAWEVGPRFLVIGLPALAPLLALAWRSYRRPLWRSLALALFGMSLVNGLVVFQHPELPYKSSLPLYYGQRLGLLLIHLLPDMAGYTQIVAGEHGEIGLAAGQRLVLIDSGPLADLPFGHYRLTWPVRTEPGLPPDVPLLQLSLKTLGGGQVWHVTVTAADLPPDGRYGRLQYDIFNPTVDRWRTPLIFHAASTGRARIWAGDVLFSPSPIYSWLLPYLAVAFLLAATAGAWRYRNRSDFSPLPGLSSEKAQQQSGLTRSPFPLPALAGWTVLLLLLLVAAWSYLLYATGRPGWTYDAGDFYHFVGRMVGDPAAADGRAWQVDPAVDPPQRAIYGPFDFYEPGTYRVAFRLKLAAAVNTGEPVARLQVSATDNFDPLVSQPLLPEHFNRPGRYHDFVLTMTNPRRQALSFDLEYLAVAPLVIDGVMVTRVD